MTSAGNFTKNNEIAILGQGVLELTILKENSKKLMSSEKCIYFQHNKNLYVTIFSLQLPPIFNMLETLSEINYLSNHFINTFFQKNNKKHQWAVFLYLKLAFSGICKFPYNSFFSDLKNYRHLNFSKKCLTHTHTHTQTENSNSRRLPFYEQESWK